MKKHKVIHVSDDTIEFDGNIKLYSYHIQDCCENHYLSMSDLKIEDFDNLEFDLSIDNIFRKIEGYGIELIPIKGFPIRIPGYGYNNGYYSTELKLILKGDDFKVTYDISTCQKIIG